MRVISGEFRGMNLYAPKDWEIRPTTDRIKEDMFNIISPYVAESVFLDLFAGTGSIAIEAVSRGAKRAVLVENGRESLSLIKKNLEKTKKAGEFQVVRSDVVRFLLTTRDKYDIIFLDPPYAYPGAEQLLRLIDERELICEDGMLVIEQGKEARLPEEVGRLSLVKTKTYSLTKMHFYKRLAKEPL